MSLKIGLVMQVRNDILTYEITEIPIQLVQFNVSAMYASYSDEYI